MIGVLVVHHYSKPLAGRNLTELPNALFGTLGVHNLGGPKRVEVRTESFCGT